MVNNSKISDTIEVKVGNVPVGGNNRVVIQSMTNTLTTNIKDTVAQVIDLYNAGSEIVRVTVNDLESAKAIPKIIETLKQNNFCIPIVGCFHYNGHTLLSQVPECAKLLAKYRINPGNVGFNSKRDKNFEQIIELAIKYNKPVRIGVNWGSLDQSLVSDLMDKNSKLPVPRSLNLIIKEAMIKSALQSADRAEKIGLKKNKIIISAKLSKPQDLISIYRTLSKECNYPLHIGLTEAGAGIQGITATTVALSILLQEGIGNTIRASLTPSAKQSRTTEVKLCQEILQSLGIRNFSPQIISCPGCGRTSSVYFQELAQDIQDHIDNNVHIWKKQYKGVEFIRIAIMGCIVNGPGESKHANIGISLPGNKEKRIAVVYTNGYKTHTLKGNHITQQFIELVNQYIDKKCVRISM